MSLRHTRRLTDAALSVYAAEYGRTGCQGGLQSAITSRLLLAFLASVATAPAAH